MTIKSEHQAALASLSKEKDMEREEIEKELNEYKQMYHDEQDKGLKTLETVLKKKTRIKEVSNSANWSR